MQIYCTCGNHKQIHVFAKNVKRIFRITFSKRIGLLLFILNFRPFFNFESIGSKIQVQNSILNIGSTDWKTGWQTSTR